MKREEAALMWAVVELDARACGAWAFARYLGIPEKRFERWLEKWLDRGWWDYGVSLRSGWVPDESEYHPPREQTLQVMREFLAKHAPKGWDDGGLRSQLQAVADEHARWERRQKRYWDGVHAEHRRRQRVYNLPTKPIPLTGLSQSTDATRYLQKPCPWLKEVKHDHR